MNILFRKNFRTEASKEPKYGKVGGGVGGCGGAGRRRGVSAGAGGVHGNRKRDSGYTMMESHSYRTHIFLSPITGPQDAEEDPAAVRSSSSSYAFLSWSNMKRKPSLPGRTEPAPLLPPSNYPSRQVSFSGSGRPGIFKPGQQLALQQVPRAEPTNLAGIDRDCFIIPVASIDRFLPDGVPLPLPQSTSTSTGTNFSVLEVDDPKLCVAIHLMSRLEPIEPLLESPLAMPLATQQMTARDLLGEIAATKSAAEGILLGNIEKDAEFPFICYYVVNKNQTEPKKFFNALRHTSLGRFDPHNLRYTASHTFEIFNEVATIARPPLDPISKRPNSPHTGYIVTIYKVFEGDDGEKFEKNWLYWTGARMIYKSLPKSVGLRRIVLHKGQSPGDKLYLLIVECSHLLEDLSPAAALIPALRARLCGYTGLYRCINTF
nr:PREDICTED: uncharacterized protein LOC109036967 isoform X1 [Bemisia tabaci]